MGWAWRPHYIYTFEGTSSICTPPPKDPPWWVLWVLLKTVMDIAKNKINVMYLYLYSPLINVTMFYSAGHEI